MGIAENRKQIERWLETAPSDWVGQFRSGFRKAQPGKSPVLNIDNALAVLGITAGGRPSGDRAEGSYPVPDGVREEAMHGLELSWENNYGAWDFIGIARAIQLATQPGVPQSTLSRMSAYFSRHVKDKQSRRFGNDSDPSRGYMAWLNWGGDAGYRWVNTKLAKRNGIAPHTLMPLPYAYDALEPWISARTLHFHHDKHHQSYVDGLNRAEQLLCQVMADGKMEWVQAINADQAFNWGGDFLHRLYWHNLTPDYQPPSQALVRRVEKSFGSWERFREYLKTSTIKIKGSGWGVLVLFPDGSLRVASVHNHEDRVLWQAKPLLAIDIWEHAYYLDYQNDRGKYFDAVFDHLMNWAFVERRLREG